MAKSSYKRIQLDPHDTSILNTKTKFTAESFPELTDDLILEIVIELMEKWRMEYTTMVGNPRITNKEEHKQHLLDKADYLLKEATLWQNPEH